MNVDFYKLGVELAIKLALGKPGGKPIGMPGESGTSTRVVTEGGKKFQETVKPAAPAAPGQGGKPHLPNVTRRVPYYGK